MERAGRIFVACALAVVAVAAVAGVFGGSEGASGAGGRAGMTWWSGGEGRTALFGMMGAEEALSELTFSGSGAKALALSGACQACTSRILEKHKPWVASDRIDPEEALSCASEGACKEASKQSAILAAKTSIPRTVGAQQLAESRAGRSPAMRMSKEEFMYEVRELDAEQLALNWQKARLFAKYAGAPRAAGTTYALATVVPAVDPKGRPVPSWLKFTPTAMSLFQMGQEPAGATKAVEQEMATEFAGGLKPLSTVTPMSSPGGGMPHHTQQLATSHAQVCALKNDCDSCTRKGCQWCGGSELCSSQCANLASVTVYSHPPNCPASSVYSKAYAQAAGQANLASKQAQNRLELKSLVSLSESGLTGTGLVAASAQQDLRIKATALKLPGQQVRRRNPRASWEQELQSLDTNARVPTSAPRPA